MRLYLIWFHFTCTPNQELTQPPKYSIATCSGPTPTWLTILSPSVTILLVSPSLMYHHMDAKILFFRNAVNLASSPPLLPSPRCFHCGFWNSCSILNNCSHFCDLFSENSLYLLSLNEIWLLPERLFLLPPQGQTHCIIYSPWSENCRSLLILTPCHFWTLSYHSKQLLFWSHVILLTILTIPWWVIDQTLSHWWTLLPHSSVIATLTSIDSHLTPWPQCLDLSGPTVFFCCLSQFSS